MYLLSPLKNRFLLTQLNKYSRLRTKNKNLLNNFVTLFICNSYKNLKKLFKMIYKSQFF